MVGRGVQTTVLLCAGLLSACVGGSPLTGAADGGAVDAPRAPDALSPTDLADPLEVATTSLRALEFVPRVAPRCDRDDDAPLRTGDDVDAMRCVRVGARALTSDARWPDDSLLTGLTLYVDPDADPNGVGTRESPLRTLSRAVSQVPEARNVVLSRGVHSVADTVALSRALNIVGVGAGVSVLEVSRARVGLRVANGAVVSLTDLTLRFADGAPSTEDVALSSAGALALRDVSVEPAAIGVDLTEGSLVAQRLTVRGASRFGVRATGGARVELADFVVRDGAGQGIRVEGGHASLTRGLVARNARHGVVLIRATDATGGRGRCADLASRGPLDCVDQLVSQGNGVAAMYVSDARRVELRRSTLADTAMAPIEGGEAGDGLFVSADADLSLDPELISPAVRGFGSAVTGNARAGIVAQGARARIAVRGAVIARNASGGVFVGAQAQARVIGESFFVENRFAGIVATPGSEVGIVQCNGIVDTQMGSVRGSTATVQLGDGVHVNAASGMTSLRDNTILRSAAFGLLVNVGRVELQGNRGVENRYGVGAYGGAVVAGDPRSIVGREAPPSMAPGLASELR